jgi:hypothetical protein
VKEWTKHKQKKLRVSDQNFDGFLQVLLSNLGPKRFDHFLPIPAVFAEILFGQFRPHVVQILQPFRRFQARPGTDVMIL